MKSPTSYRSSSPRRQDRISMTPMIDIVFLLIIFFLVSSHLSRQENRHPVTLSQAETGALGDPNASPLTITLDNESRIHFAGTLITIEQLRPRIIVWLETQQSSSASDANVRLRIDQSVPYGRVEPILKELALLSIANVSIIVNPRLSSVNSRTESLP